MQFLHLSSQLNAPLKTLIFVVGQIFMGTILIGHVRLAQPSVLEQGLPQIIRTERLKVRPRHFIAKCIPVM